MWTNRKPLRLLVRSNMSRPYIRETVGSTADGALEPFLSGSVSVTANGLGANGP